MASVWIEECWDAKYRKRNENSDNDFIDVFSLASIKLKEAEKLFLVW